MEPDPERPELALCVDVLAPEGYGEIIGGSQRIASYELLLKRIHEHELPEEAFKWYLDLRKYGSVPHSRLRHGHRARGGLDLRPGARARDHSLPAHAAPVVSVRGETDGCAPAHVTSKEDLWQPARSPNRYRTSKPSTSASSACRSTLGSRAAAWTWVRRRCASPASKPSSRRSATT